MKRYGSVLAVTILVLVLCQAFTAVGYSEVGKRLVKGTVYYAGGEIAKDAAVELEDKLSMQVISQRTDVAGHYHFPGLDPDRVYELRATKKGYWSKAHTVSKFSSRLVEVVDLYLKPGEGK